MRMLAEQTERIGSAAATTTATDKKEDGKEKRTPMILMLDDAGEIMVI